MLLRRQKRSNSHIYTAVVTENIVRTDKGIKRRKPKKKKKKQSLLTDVVEFTGK